MVADKNKLNTAGNRQEENPVIHADGETDKGTAFMNAQAFGKLTGEVAIDKSDDRLFGLFLNFLRQS